MGVNSKYSKNADEQKKTVSNKPICYSVQLEFRNKIRLGKSGLFWSLKFLPFHTNVKISPSGRKFGVVGVES